MNRRTFAALAVLAFGALAFGALPRPAAAQELPFDLNLDYAAFLYGEDESLLELYLSIGAASLDYRAEEGRFVAALPIEIALRPAATAAPSGASAAPILDDTTMVEFAVADTSTLDDEQVYLQLFQMAVAPGEYALDLTVPGEGGRPEVRLNLDGIVVPDYSRAAGAAVSGLTLASDIRQGDADARFYKNGLIVTPNPAAVFGGDQDRLFYYAEAYGLPEATDLQEYTVFAYLSESGLPQPMEGYQRRAARAVRDPDVLVGAFDVGALPSASYFLHVALLDENNEALAEQSKKFFVFNPDVERPVVAVDEGFETSLYAVMGEEDVEDNLRHAAVIATQQELAQLRRLLDLDAKRQFLATFWHARDADADPAENRARREFYERLRYAEDRYATPFQEGYETDRGRALLRYGYPSQVDPRPFESELLPHEVWVYESLPGQGGQALFVFADREGVGRYDLIHSTATGEVSLPNWERMLRR